MQEIFHGHGHGPCNFLNLQVAMKKFQLPNEFSVLGLAHLRKSVSGHVPVLFMCCE